jgi:hypothetical protein
MLNRCEFVTCLERKIIYIQDFNSIVSVEIPLAVSVLIMLLQAIPRGNHLFSIIDARHRFTLFPWANHQTSEGKIFSPSQ